MRHFIFFLLFTGLISSCTENKPSVKSPTKFVPEYVEITDIFTIPDLVSNLHGLAIPLNSQKIEAFNTGTSVLLKSTKPDQSGIKFNFILQPDIKYQLSLRGQQISGDVVVRIREDNEEAKYKYPDTVKDMVFHGVSNLEFLIYSESRFEYKIDLIDIAPCDLCKSKSDLKSKIVDDLRDAPNSELPDTFETLANILGWAAVNADYTIESEIGNSSTRLISRKEVHDIFYNLYETNSAAGYCGALADFTSKVYRLFGYNAFTVGFGIKGTNLTHVTTIVSVMKNGNPEFYMLDPTFNGYFVDGVTKAPITFSQVLRMNPDELVFLERSVVERDVLIGPNSLDQCEKNKHEDGKYVACEGSDFSLQTYYVNSQSEMISHAIEPNLKGFVELMKIEFFNIQPSDHIEEFKEVLAANGIKY